MNLHPEENYFIQIPNFVFIKNLKSEYITCNLNFARSIGLSSVAEAFGKSDFDTPWANTHAELYREGDREVMDNRPKINVLETQRKSNGDIITIQINKTPLLDKNNQIIGVVGSYMELLPHACGQYTANKINISLTKEQGEILYYYALGMTLPDVADKLELSLSDMNMQINILKKKLQCSNHVALMQKALTIDFVKRRLFGCDQHSQCDDNGFTKRELSIIQLIAFGKTAKEAAHELGLSFRTVENYIAAVKLKLNVKTKSQLISKILGMGLFYYI